MVGVSRWVVGMGDVSLETKNASKRAEIYKKRQQEQNILEN